MTLEKKMSKIFKLDEENWMKHANPWSVWTRNTVLPALVIAFWSRVWLGWWAIVPIILAVIWTYVNPRTFARPESTDNWASKAVLGERVWSNRDKVPLPEHHKRVPRILSNISGIGGLFVIWGVLFLDIWPLLLGLSLVYCCKLWFLDRMVWLFEDMKHVEEYGEWLY